MIAFLSSGLARGPSTTAPTATAAIPTPSGVPPNTDSPNSPNSAIVYPPAVRCPTAPRAADKASDVPAGTPDGAVPRPSLGASAIMQRYYSRTVYASACGVSGGNTWGYGVCCPSQRAQ